MADNPNGNNPVDPEPQFTPEQEAAMAAARAQAEAMIRDIVTPMIEGSNKAIIAEMRKAISELGAAIPEAVDKCLAQRIAEAKVQAGTAQVEQPQSGTAEKAVVATGGDNRMGQIAGLFQLLGPMMGIGPAAGQSEFGKMADMFKAMAQIQEAAVSPFIKAMSIGRQTAYEEIGLRGKYPDLFERPKVAVPDEQ